MPRYLIERTFHENLILPGPEQGEVARLAFIENNSLDGVTWIHSYVSPDRKKSFCIYDAPSPEALRRAAQRNDLPIDRITEVQVLDAFFYTGEVTGDK
jgi:hypothetical protein